MEIYFFLFFPIFFIFFQSTESSGGGEQLKSVFWLAWPNLHTTQDVKKLRIQLKFLTCDYLTNDRIALDRPGVSPLCDLCLDQGLDSRDTIEHVLASCIATAEVRRRLYPELVNTVAQVQPMCSILLCNPPPSILTQFVLDCTSLNLPGSYRVPMHNPGISKICKVSRDWCYAINSERWRLLKLRTKW